MKFQFQLAGLLKVRQIEEDQAEARLEQAMLRLRALDNRLQEAHLWRTKTALVLAHNKFLPAIETHHVSRVLQQTRTAMLACQRQKEEEKKRVAELQKAYLEARQRRETVSTLRDEAFQRFRVEVARRDQMTLDENYLGKLLHTRATTSSEAAPVSSCEPAAITKVKTSTVNGERTDIPATVDPQHLLGQPNNEQAPHSMTGN